MIKMPKRARGVYVIHGDRFTVNEYDNYIGALLENSCENPKIKM